MESMNAQEEAKKICEQLFEVEQQPFEPMKHHRRSSSHKRVGRNSPCYCGSGKKFKKCCLGTRPC